MEVRQRLVREDQKKKTCRLGQLTSSEPGDHADLAPPEELSQAGERRGRVERRGGPARGNHSPGCYTVKNKATERERKTV